MSFDGYWPCLCTHNDGRDRVLHPPYEERCAACQVIRPAPEEGEEIAPTPPPLPDDVRVIASWPQRLELEERVAAVIYNAVASGSVGRHTPMTQLAWGLARAVVGVLEGQKMPPPPAPSDARASVRGRIFECITLERTLQDEKWGADRDLSTPWAAVLMEEAGEVARAHLEAKHHPSGHRAGLAHLKTEPVQLAAVAVAWIEAVHVEDERAGRGYDDA